MKPMIILASRSPRRVELLKQMGIDCVTMPADIDETPMPNEVPTDYVLRMAKEKAEVGVQMLKLQGVIIAADTTVVLKGQVLGKPGSDDDARDMLRGLSGTQHEVHTAVALAVNGVIELALSTTLVEMMQVDATQIEAYIATGEHRDKAGSYGIQGAAGMWIKRIEGSFTGVMGLPVFETAQLLRKAGILTI